MNSGANMSTTTALPTVRSKTAAILLAFTDRRCSCVPRPIPPPSPLRLAVRHRRRPLLLGPHVCAVQLPLLRDGRAAPRLHLHLPQDALPLPPHPSDRISRFLLEGC